LADINGSLRSHLSEIKWISDLFIDEVQSNDITMKAIILMIICILVTIQGYAQTTPKKIKLYNARIRTMEDKKLIKGTFYAFNDSIIVLINATSKAEIKNHHFISTEIPVTNVKWIKIRRIGKIGSSALVGGLVAGTTVAIIVYTNTNDQNDSIIQISQEQLAGILGGAFFCIGSCLGAVSGTQSKHFEINGMPERIIEYHEILNQYSISKISLRKNKQIYLP